MTRDRYSNYQKATSAGAPQAIQVTDHWYLLKNLDEAVQKVLVKQYRKTNAVLASKPSHDDPRKLVAVQPVPDENKSDDGPPGFTGKQHLLPNYQK